MSMGRACGLSSITLLPHSWIFGAIWMPRVFAIPAIRRAT
jgi:hypothetical protein